ncbi:MAG: magnesium transporter [Intrasporangiaceae bacterium]|nr:magnesium transporter [Intrasporangiaceae bacterium]
MNEPTLLWDDRELTAALSARDLPRARDLAAGVSAQALETFLGRLPSSQQAVLFRLLAKDHALEVFEFMSAGSQAQLVAHLQDDEVAAVFDDLDPDDRVGLLDELPAKVAKRLMHGLSPAERQLTATVLGYPEGSVGRRMSPEVIPLRVDSTVNRALARVHNLLDAAETIYTLPVVDDERRVVGVVGLRDLLRADPNALIGDLSRPADLAYATESAEEAARRCADAGRLALPIVDSEDRLVGILTVDDALSVLEAAESEDQARQGGSEPLRSPYLSTPRRQIVRSRIVWLLVLAVGATLTVQVLETFESTLEQMVVLSVFIPLLIGTGGNTGNQAATTVTRAMALGDVRPSDALKVVAREGVVGLFLGLILGGLAFVIVSVVYSVTIGEVIGLTMLIMCTLAAVAGGVIPLIARVLRADPAVFSNPFISTLIDATGLIIYFLIARALLGL